MMKMKWSRWVDEFGSNKDDFGLEEEDLDDWDDDDDDFDGITEQHGHGGAKYIGKVLCTHHGMFPIREHERAGDIFDFWTLQTDFNIDGDIATAIEETPGVETLFVLTRYKIRVGFTKSGLFDTAKVQKNVERRVRDSFRYSKVAQFISSAWGCDLNTVGKVRTLKSQIADNNSVWAMYVAPNSKIDVFICEDDGVKFYQKLQVYRDAEACVGGKIFTFMDDKETCPLV